MGAYLFVDLSYYVFFRYFALQRWCKISKQETLLQDEDAFMEKFAKLFEDNLVDLKKRHKVEWKDIALVKDCMRSTIWRNCLYPPYKQNRDSSRQEFDPRAFGYAYQTVLPNLQQKYAFKVIEYPRAEADDVIAVLHKTIRETEPERKIIIVTNDNDYVQLSDENTLLINLGKVELTSRFNKEVMSCFKLWKVIKGDVSDNIPPIDKNIGDKTALKLALSPEALEKKLSSDPSVRERFELNMKLIGFCQIPDDIAYGVKAAWACLHK